MIRGNKWIVILPMCVLLWTFVVYFGMKRESAPTLEVASQRVWELGMKAWYGSRNGSVPVNRCTCPSITPAIATGNTPNKEGSWDEAEEGRVVPMTPEPPPKLPLPDVETTKKNWSAHCSYPSYIPENVQKEPWFPRYLWHLQRVDLSTSSVNRRPVNCARWWYATPQLTYDEVPHREKGWKAPPTPPPSYQRPKCPFGQENRPKTRCAKLYEPLWRTLEQWSILYFPRGGTELGIARGSGYVKSDGDIDVFIDHPPRHLVTKLQKVLSPKPYLSGAAYKVATETWWKPKGCPTVHMVFNDWMADEMAAEFGRPTHMDSCDCMMDGVRMTCHKQAFRRTYIMYGPSWKVPLHSKGLDVPQRAKPYNIAGRLIKWTSRDGIIHEDVIRKMDKTKKYDNIEMEMSLAHLNVLKNLIDYQKKTKDTRFV